jgi:indole-3-glycerol phosphate synthase
LSILDEIVGHKKTVIEASKQEVALNVLKAKLTDADKTRPFKKAISTPGGIKLIAEIKKASPSRGVIRDDFDPLELARIYEENGAAAISVLTDRKFFQGNINFLSGVRRATAVPLLRKDFIIDEYQIYESRVYGADALLLIAAVLSREELDSFLSLSRDLDLDCLVEVHSEEEVKKVLETSAEIIGINNRNLGTFEVDLSTTLRLKRLISPDKIVVSESGIRGREEVRFLAGKGIDAILVGEALLRSEDVGEKMRELRGGEK